MSAIVQWIASLPPEQQAAARASVEAEVQQRAQDRAQEMATAMVSQQQFDPSSSPNTSSSPPAATPGVTPAPTIPSMPQQMYAGAPDGFTVAMVRPPAPDHFRGDRAKVEEFIDQLHRYVALSNISMMPHHIQVQQAALLLKDEALVWFRNANSNTNPIVSVVDLTSRMRAYFLPYGYDKLARTRLRSLKQVTSVQAYNTLFMRTLQHITDMSPADQLEYYITGLKEKIKEKLWAKEPKTLQDAMTEATIAEARFQHLYSAAPRTQYQFTHRFGGSAQSSSTGSMRVASSSATTNAASSSGGADAMDLSKVESSATPDADEQLNAMQGQRLGKLSDTDRARLRAEGRCFRCRAKGHISSQCPKNGLTQ